MSDTNTTGQIAPEQLAAILSAAAKAVLAQQQASSTTATDATPATAVVAPADPAGTSTAAAAGADAALAPTAQALPVPPAPTMLQVSGQAGDAQATDPEQLALLKKIDTNLTDLSTRIVTIEKTAVRNGAIAGGVAGGVSGGIVAAGLAFARAHLGL
ncbi:hypothetical protein AB3X91_30700 [Paraburkholderia sp. BR14263]|uniref:hypothetical protein n=1 Tax=unclassified Paraburkholderia TaxID=2615204 RepID=UPI0034CE6D5B